MEDVLILGMGEIGKAISKIEKYNKKQVSFIDLDTEDIKSEDYGMLHVCIPFNDYDNFKNTISRLLTKYNIEYIIIHSTIPMGTTNKLSTELNYHTICHSPVLGVHPELSLSLLTFKKPIGSVNKKHTDYFMKYLTDIGLTPEDYLKPENTEFAKLMSTTRYGIEISFVTYLKDMCDKFNLDFDLVHYNWTANYNNGYVTLNKDYVVRSVLDANTNGLGGHCVFENLMLLPSKMLDDKFIKQVALLGKKKTTKLKNSELGKKVIEFERFLLEGKYKNRCVIVNSKPYNVNYDNDKGIILHHLHSEETLVLNELDPDTKILL